MLFELVLEVWLAYDPAVSVMLCMSKVHEMHIMNCTQ